MAIVMPAPALGRMIHITHPVGVKIFVVVAFQAGQQRSTVALHISVLRKSNVGVLVRICFARDTAAGTRLAAKKYYKRQYGQAPAEIEVKIEKGEY